MARAKGHKHNKFLIPCDNPDDYFAGIEGLCLVIINYIHVKGELV